MRLLILFCSLNALELPTEIPIADPANPTIAPAAAPIGPIDAPEEAPSSVLCKTFIPICPPDKPRTSENDRLFINDVFEISLFND